MATDEEVGHLNYHRFLKKGLWLRRYLASLGMWIFCFYCLLICLLKSFIFLCELSDILSSMLLASERRILECISKWQVIFTFPQRSKLSHFTFFLQSKAIAKQLHEITVSNSSVADVLLTWEFHFTPHAMMIACDYKELRHIIESSKFINFLRKAILSYSITGISRKAMNHVLCNKSVNFQFIKFLQREVGCFGSMHIVANISISI